MRILITRPKASGEKTAARLSRRGFEPLLLPLTEARHDREAVAHALSLDAAALAITSAEAVRALAGAGPMPASLLALPVYAVGTATAEAVAQAGFTRIITGGGTGLALAETVIADAPRFGERPLVYLAGAPRHPDFEDALDAADIYVRSITIYAMQPVAGSNAALAAFLSAGPIDAVLFHSREAARQFFALAASADPKDFGTTRFLCLSDNVAEAVPEPFRAACIVAARPEEMALLALIEATP